VNIPVALLFYSQDVTSLVNIFSAIYSFAEKACFSNIFSVCHYEEVWVLYLLTKPVNNTECSIVFHISGVCASVCGSDVYLAILCITLLENLDSVLLWLSFHVHP
jgi:hypothetical protein